MENNCILYRILSRPCYGLSFVSVHKCSIVIVCKCPSVFASVFSLFKCVFSVDQCLCVHQCLQMFMKAYQSFKVFLSFKSVYSLYNIIIIAYQCSSGFLGVNQCFWGCNIQKDIWLRLLWKIIAYSVSDDISSYITTALNQMTFEKWPLTLKSFVGSSADRALLRILSNFAAHFYRRKTKTKHVKIKRHDWREHLNALRKEFKESSIKPSSVGLSIGIL